jgi:hypothetical protein
MRQRRTGSAARTRRPGPKRKADPIRDLFPDWSATTYARYRKAFDRLRKVEAYGLEAGAHEKAVKAASRPNGSINVAKLERVSEDIAAMALARLDFDRP